MFNNDRGFFSRVKVRQYIDLAGRTLYTKKMLALFLAFVVAFLVFPRTADGETTSTETQPTQTYTVDRSAIKRQIKSTNFWKKRTRRYAHSRGTHVRGAHNKTRMVNSIKYATWRTVHWKKLAKKQKRLYLRERNSVKPCVGFGAPRSICFTLKDAARAIGKPAWANDPKLLYIIRRESGFSCSAQNPNSTAYGLFQFLNSTWSGTGYRKSSSCLVQAKAGLTYIKKRYGTPTGAYNFWRANSWY